MMAVYLVLTHDPGYALVIDHMPACPQFQRDSTIAISHSPEYIVDVFYQMGQLSITECGSSRPGLMMEQAWGR